jgi:hypothetical protein
MRVLCLALLTVALWLLPLGRERARASDGVPLRRFALTVAANDGGPARETLQYAERDARALADVLQQLGGVDGVDTVRLLQPSAEALRAAFAALQQRVRDAEAEGVRTEVVFYYSGHSDDSALLLGRERVPYPALRQLLEELPTQVRIAILDSCASGAFTREKGGVKRAPFLVDASTEVRGHAFLTSASADEAAQESDRIGGSFFTHYLVSGLRGAADASGDRKITLTEAYRFAFEETLARTAPTQYGSQHPAYEIRLAGTGDLVMTDLRSTKAELVVDESVEGRLFVWGTPRTLLIEVDKRLGRRVVLALPPGSYRLELARGAHYYVAETIALSGQSSPLARNAFHEVERETTLARGVVEQFALHPFAAGLIPPLTTNHHVRVRQGRPVLDHVGVALMYDAPDALEGLQLSLFGIAARRYAKGLQFGLFFTDTGELLGVQLSGVANAARTFGSGLQLAGAVNYAGIELRGLQVAALNYAEALYGAQLTLGINVARERMAGLQVGSLSWARHAHGVQVGFCNLVGDLHGLQVGALNVARGAVHGVQVGVINYADEADFSIGALGMTRQGGAHLSLGFDELFAPELSLRLDAKYNYSFVGGGIAPYGPERGAYGVGAGLGLKAPLFVPALWLDVDLGFFMVQPVSDFRRGVPNSLWRIRALARYELHKHFSVFAGLTLNTYLQLDEHGRFLPDRLVTAHRLTSSDGEAQVWFWPGFAAGLRL